MSIIGIYARTSADSDSTSIEQQKNAGIEFCKIRNFEFRTYEDVGKSGYKIDDENDLFVNRQGIMNLISDIESGIISKVWVWENSRLSRNEITQLKLNQIFIKYNILLYVKDTLYDLNNPQNKLIHGIFNQISEYERHNIVARTKRGIHDSINRGIRGYKELYGYKIDGKEGKYAKWVPIDSEIEKLKYFFNSYLNGENVNSIITGMYKDKLQKEIIALAKRWRFILKQFNYTGYILNIEGLKLYNKFKNNEIENLNELNNKKYYIESPQFPIKIITIGNWISIIEKLKIKSVSYNEKRQRTNSEMLTGIISCPYCNLKYFVMRDKNHYCYRHFFSKDCKQSPKTLKIEKIDSLFSLFFFYFYLVYDNTKVLIEENQKLIKINQAEIKDKIKIFEKENKEIQVQINNFKSIYKTAKDIDKINLTIEKEIELKKDLQNNNLIIEKLNNELENLKIKFNKDKIELTYYNTKELVINFIENMNKEEKRLSLIKIIKKCQLFCKYLLIESGKVLFVFDIKLDYGLPESVYNEFKNDINFKDNFLNSNSLLNENGEFTSEIQKFFDMPNEEIKKHYSNNKLIEIQKNIDTWQNVRYIGILKTQEYFMNIENKIFFKELLEKSGIKYNLTDINKIVFISD